MNIQKTVFQSRKAAFFLYFGMRKPPSDCRTASLYKGEILCLPYRGTSDFIRLLSFSEKPPVLPFCAYGFPLPVAHRGGCLSNTLSTIPRPLQNIFTNNPELTKRIFHNYPAQRQLPEVGLFNPLLQLAAGIGFIRNVPPRLQNRQRFGSTIK